MTKRSGAECASSAVAVVARTRSVAANIFEKPKPRCRRRRVSDFGVAKRETIETADAMRFRARVGRASYAVRSKYY